MPNRAPRPVCDKWKQLRSGQIRPQLALGHGIVQLVGQQSGCLAGLKIILALPQDDGSRRRPGRLRLGQHARAFDRIEGEVGAGSLLELETVPPGGEFIGPGFDGIDVTAGLLGDERAAPAVVAVMSHRLAPPLPVALEPPYQRCVHDIVAVAIDVRPDIDTLADDPLDGKAAVVDARINVFNVKCACGGALDSLSCFVHGDANDMEKTPRFGRGKGAVPNTYTKPLAEHWFPGNAVDGVELNTAILFPHFKKFATFFTVACKRHA